MPLGEDLPLDQQFALLDFEAGRLQQAAHARVVLHIEDARDARPRFAGADHFRRSAPAEQQPKGIHHDGFAAARLAGQQIQARMEMDAQPLDHRVVLDHQFQEHACARLYRPRLDGVHRAADFREFTLELGTRAVFEIRRERR